MRVATLLLFLTAVLAGCDPPEQEASGGTADAAGAEVHIELPRPAQVGPAELAVRVSDGGAPVRGAMVELTGDMTHAGMEPVIRTATGGEDGRYHTSDFTFTMAGDWIVTAEVTLPGGDTVREEIRVSVSRP